MWTRIKQASDKKTTAVSDFVGKYREPVRKFIVNLGFSKNDAEDLTQEVFLKIYEHKLLNIADKNKGKFRSFILAITKNIVGNFIKKKNTDKRGGGIPVVSLDMPIGDTKHGTLADIITVQVKDESFDSLWMETILKGAMEKLKTECEQKGLPYYDAYSTYIADRDASYTTVAQKLNVNENQVKHYLQRGKKKLIGFIREEIQSYCSTKEEFEEELAYLPRFLMKKL